MNLTLYPLREYCGLLDKLGLLAAPLPDGLDLDRAVELVSYNSREAVPGTLFLCKGAHFKAEYLAQAAQKGAFAYVSETPYPGVELPCILVRDMRRVLATLAVKYYNDPSRKIKVVGVTGTKGKTTTVWYLKAILDEYLAPGGTSCGLLSSLETWDGVERSPSHMTTPEPLELQRHLARAAANRLEYVVMEASSQGLKYHRTLGTKFAAAAFLNIGTDHISPIEHPDFDDYFHSKLKIFAQADFSCVNLDCDHAQEALSAAREACGTVFTFSRQDPAANVYGHDVRKAGGDLLFGVEAAQLTGQYRLTVPGLFNVDNALAAITICRGLGIPQEAVREGLARARVPGRMEVYSSENGNVVVIVDYAHNQMSLETLLRSVRAEYPDHRVVAVFGCTGGKGLDRRAGMGKVAGKYADQVFLTEDDPDEEDPVEICHEIAAYVTCPFEIWPNRSEAVRQAILGCDRPTVVVVAGKGAERHQKRGGEYVETPSDTEYVRAFLREYDARRGR